MSNFKAESNVGSGPDLALSGQYDLEHSENKFSWT